MIRKSKTGSKIITKLCNSLPKVCAEVSIRTTFEKKERIYKYSTKSKRFNVRFDIFRRKFRGIQSIALQSARLHSGS